MSGLLTVAFTHWSLPRLLPKEEELCGEARREPCRVALDLRELNPKAEGGSHLGFFSCHHNKMARRKSVRGGRARSAPQFQGICQDIHHGEESQQREQETAGPHGSPAKRKSRSACDTQLLRRCYPQRAGLPASVRSG